MSEMPDCVVSDGQSLQYDAAYRSNVPDILINGKLHNSQSSLHHNYNSGCYNLVPNAVLPDKLTPVPETLSPNGYNQLNNTLSPVQDPSITSQSSSGLWTQHGSPPPYCFPTHPEPDVVLRPDGPPVQPQQWPTFVQKQTFQEPLPLIAPPHFSRPHTSPPPTTYIPRPSPSPSGIPIAEMLPQTPPQVISSQFSQATQMLPHSQQQPQVPHPHHHLYNPLELNSTPNNTRLNIQSHHTTPLGSVTSFEFNGTVYYSYNGQYPMMPGFVPFIPVAGPVYFSNEDNEMAAEGKMNQNGQPNGQPQDDWRHLATQTVLPAIEVLKPDLENGCN